ncbi:hypothetical protein [Azospirillum sp.]|uniref:hypothetical protein n=1 Tax=Azospirillum sp. TaxID=34012 RepID=UPI002D3E3FFE|nr:hypothetical protein [Azospirillum sp.]HYD65824.1 hypothetical protein [Azospirillum sp.]
MRVLKAAIIIMGVFILAGYAYLGVEVVKRFSNKVTAEPQEAAEDRPLPAGPTGEVSLNLPSGARIGEMLAVGNRVVFRVTIPDGADRLYTLDPRSGAVSSVVTTGSR